MYLTVFLACSLADLFTYFTTALELALAYPAEVGGIMSSFILFLGIFAVTQVPLAIVEGVVLALVFKYIVRVETRHPSPSEGISGRKNQCRKE